MSKILDMYKYQLDNVIGKKSITDLRIMITADAGKFKFLFFYITDLFQF